MDLALDETSLVPCLQWSPAKRIFELAKVLKAFDRIGMPRVLRTVTNAASRDIGQGRGLQHWCFDHGTDRDAGKLLAMRLTKTPFIDGADGLFAQAEGDRVLEVQLNNEAVFGLALGALEDRPVAALVNHNIPTSRHVKVQILDASSDPITVTDVPVHVYVCDEGVDGRYDQLQQLVDSSILNGQTLIDRLDEVFPYVQLGAAASLSIAALTGNEIFFRQLVKHLRALNNAVEVWLPGSQYKPEGITWSPESDQTLDHPRFGPIRDFPVPEGFQQHRWSHHTKLTGGAGIRMYFRAVMRDDMKTVLIGYFGNHLPCVNYPH